MARRKKLKKVGSKKSIIKAISKRLDRQIKIKMTELKKKSLNPEKITYIYVTDNLEVKWKK